MVRLAMDGMAGKKWTWNVNCILGHSETEAMYPVGPGAFRLGREG